MTKYIPRYKETKNKVIKMCLVCYHVEELAESEIDCPTCKSIGYMGFWESPEKFYNYVKMYKPKNLRVHGEHLQHLVDEALGLV